MRKGHSERDPKRFDSLSLDAERTDYQGVRHMQLECSQPLDANHNSNFKFQSNTHIQM